MIALTGNAAGKKISPVKGLFARSVLGSIVAMYALGKAPEAEGGIILGDNVQALNSYSIVDDANTEGYDVTASITWSNISDNFPANNQISANGLFGSLDSGLYDISTTEFEHFLNPPTYSIFNNAFNIAYASGVVNTPGNTDSFSFRFNIGDITEQEANDVVAALNAAIAGTTPFENISNNNYILQSTINGFVDGGGGVVPKPFENSPTVYVPNIAAIRASIRTTNGTQVVWLEEYGYTNDFEAADFEDPDQDSFLNWQEYQADTCPTNGQSYLSLGMDGANLTFAASSNCSYAIEWAESLSSSNTWNTLTNDLAGVDGPMSVPDSPRETNRFYRLKAWRK